MLGNERREFGFWLRQLRQKKNLTLRHFPKKCRIPFPNISAIECGHLGAGRIVANKLAAGLNLQGKQRATFLSYAAFTNSRDRLSKEHLAYPGILANLLPAMLREAGVTSGEIVSNFWVDSEIMHHPEPEPVWARRTALNPRLKKYLEQPLNNAAVVVLRLKSGRQIAIRCELEFF